MPDLVVPVDKGLNTAGDETILGPGFLRECSGWVYAPDDPSRLHKQWGNTVAEDTLPETTSVKGIEYAQFRNTNPVLFYAANSRLFYADAAESIGAWTEIKDQQGSPVAFVWGGGDYLKALTDGRNRWILWTGSSAERPLVVDEDRNARFLGMKAPAPLQYPTAGTESSARLTAVPTVIRPDASSTPATIDFSARTITAFTDGSRAFDNNLETYAFCSDHNTALIHAINLTFTDAGSTSGHLLTVLLEGIFGSGSTAGHWIYVPRYGSYDPLWVPGSSVSGSGDIRIRMSTTGAAGAFTTYYVSSASATTGEPIQIAIPDGILWTNVVVQVTFEYSGSIYDSGVRVIEAFAQLNTAGGADFVDAGTYFYTTTEVFMQALDNGGSISVESAPGNPVPVEILTEDTNTGIKLTLPAQVNLATDGVEHDPANGRSLKRRIYRSTKSGVWPDLGYIAEVAITDTSFIDTFTETGPTTLGSPSINTVNLGSDITHAAGTPSPFRDATIYRGAIVYIPEDSPYEIRWSLPGFPDYYPNPYHRLTLLHSPRNDELRGIVEINENLLVFMNTRVRRIRELPLADRANYDPATIENDVLSPNEGLAGGPLAYMVFESQNGRPLCAWVSQSGIWMTDGTLVSERGMGVVKLSVHLDWENTVDTAQLSDCQLTYDPVTQTGHFDYVDTDGSRAYLILHTAPHHWIPSGQDQVVPKITGPHPAGFRALDRTIGELSGRLRHWSLNTAGTKIRNERTGDGLEGAGFTSVGETGWNYPTGALNEIMMFDGSVHHSDWGREENCDVEVFLRRDETGDVQPLLEPGLPLAGNATSSLYVSLSGQAAKVRVTHRGLTTSRGGKVRALGPFVFSVDSMGDIEED